MLRLLLIAILVTIGAGFLSSRLSTRVSTSLNGDVFFDNSCEDRLKDVNGRCPGDSKHFASSLSLIHYHSS